MGASALRHARGAPIRGARGSGFTTLELVVVCLLMAVLTVAATLRLRALRIEAERVALERMIGSLRAGLAMQAVALMVAGRESDLPQLEARNPIEHLERQPESYAGVRPADDPASVSPGRWYFEREGRRLVYRVRNADELVSPLPGPARVRFRARLLYDDRDANGRFDAGLDGFSGATLESAEPWSWR